ncbi:MULTISPECIES: ABC transporter ATP-binding protein [unclassified Mycolicibacterium]|uniref:ABC transporter ATP-binding protein n=1 Tax=unclassified Mycolicibacterium TaxID=2636767 RepID=UPI001308D627|nr:MULTISPECIES: ABC transporter ATP-binding protein [unclassified Mycolicibacterium]MUL84079.1 ABC transporter ATP-binding protein [Mycolicibacterium sp. CBMA 329]MUL89855.1 ABC transporter ATP-binding protein [Mycolicibacterium sp. CBMA 331]MUM00032.1 ABC transporter ATP-binding protein [Mycolicibacterium sp. CBMA 334]MUM28963.1 ABC transporter ATP-binding protein [Mycolicibacterium sp. CBMA 295]MUM39370.1 ABC transporter ATP-binding protein [Mycolicibacterium sp. CBMA 247]
MTAGVSFEAVSVSVRGKPLVTDISLSVAQGEVLAVVGPNGAGKTTLLRTLYRAQRPSAGRVLVDGADVWKLPGKQAARRVAAVLQEATGDFELTVFDMVAMGRTPYKRSFEADNLEDLEIIGAALAALDITELSGAGYGQLSGGQKQRVLIARALAQRTDVIVLDEPTNHLDLRHQHEALHLLRDTGATVVAALHDLNLAAAYCDRICVLDAGRLVTVGTPAEVLTVDLLADVYGVDARISVDADTGRPQITVRPKAVATL